MVQGPGTGIFSQMTQPQAQAQGGNPANLGQFLAMLAQRNQSRFGNAQDYQTRLPTGNPGDQSQHMVHRDTPLRNIGTLMQSNPFNLDAFKDSNGMLDEAQFSSYNTIGGVPLFTKNDQGGWMINPNGRYGELNNQFKGLDFRLEEDPYADGENKLRLKFNEDALPRDAFGGFGGGDVVGFEDGRNGTLRNPDMVYDDPFYGRITAPQNMQQHQDWFDKFNDMLGPILLSIAGMGLGGALGGAGLLGGGFSPSTMMSIGQGAAGALGGNPGRLLQSIISAGLPMTGLSGMPLNLTRMGTGFFSNMLNNRGGRG